MTEPAPSIAVFFSSLEDPRREHGRLHRLGDVLAVALCAILSGADSWRQIGSFADLKRDWLAARLGLEGDPPSHDTVQRVFAALAPGTFENCFVAWMNAASDAAGLQRIHIDGKTLRGSRRKDESGVWRSLHLVSAWAGANGLTLGQVACEEKSNEITAIPKLIDVLDLKGCIVTIDAEGCQKAIAKQIVEGGGDYVLQVKGNQPTLRADIERAFEAATAERVIGLDFETFTTETKGRGRRERRTHSVIHDPDGLTTAGEWEGLKAIVRVERERELKGEVSRESAYFIASAGHLRGEEWEDVTRGHWSIENPLHWTLDVVFGEDANRTKDRNACTNMALVRKVAISLLKAMPGKESMPCRRLGACCNDGCRERALAPLLASPVAPESPDATPGTASG